MQVVPDAMAGVGPRGRRIEEVAAIWRRLGDRLNLAFGLIWLAFAYGRAGRGTTPADQRSRPLSCSARPTTPPGSPSPSWTWRSC